MKIVLFIGILLFVSCSFNNPKDWLEIDAETQVTEHEAIKSWSWLELENMPIVISLPKSAIIKKSENANFAVVEDYLHIETGPYDHDDNNYAAFVIRKLKKVVSVAEYIANTPDGDGEKLLPQGHPIKGYFKDCKKGERIQNPTVSIYSIDNCSLGGFIPIYFFTIESRSYDISVIDSGANINFDVLDRIVKSIHTSDAEL